MPEIQWVAYMDFTRIKYCYEKKIDFLFYSFIFFFKEELKREKSAKSFEDFSCPKLAKIKD